ncbi:MAG TPA: hypothetical protein VMZ29_11240 [Candidatus Bathyarchaeia archaeon]|nr:hypothetical protein [Candidatus Bathyarchaeia archaeon]
MTNYYCPQFHNELTDCDISYHHIKPHLRSNKAYYCSKCCKIFCWVELESMNEQDEKIFVH